MAVTPLIVSLDTKREPMGRCSPCRSPSLPSTRWRSRATELPAGLRSLITAASWVIWALFAVDLIIRVWLSERRGRYLLTHPVDVLVVLLPALRPLRVLRIFTAGQALVTRGGRMSLLRSTRAIATAAAVLIFIAALAALDAERGAPGAHITTLGDSLWWAATTVTTVGYGDTFPVTGTGRMVAVALMVVGISLVGVITATVAAWFVSQTQDAAQAENANLGERLHKIETTLAEIHALVIEQERPARVPNGESQRREP